MYIDRHFAAVAILHVPHRWTDGWMALFERFDARFLIRLIEAQTIEQSVRMRPTASPTASSLRYSNFFSLIAVPPPLVLTAYHRPRFTPRVCVYIYNSAIGLKLFFCLFSFYFLFFFFFICERRRRHHHLIIREKGNSLSIPERGRSNIDIKHTVSFVALYRAYPITTQLETRKIYNGAPLQLEPAPFFTFPSRYY